MGLITTLLKEGWDRVDGISRLFVKNKLRDTFSNRCNKYMITFKIQTFKNLDKLSNPTLI